MNKNIIIIPVFIFLALNSKSQTVLLSEDFSSGSLPVNWSIDSAGVTPVDGWEFISPFAFPAGGGFDSNFININHWGLGIDDTINCSLVSPTFNAFAFVSVYLVFSDYYVNYPNYYGFRSIDVSNNNGLTWQTAFTDNRSHGLPNGLRTVIDISNLAGGSNQVKVRFHYTINGAQTGWAIDNVLVVDSGFCTSPPDSGITTAIDSFACTGSAVNLWLENLSRGMGQTYQWQLKNSATGYVFVNIPGAVYDTLNNYTQNGTTYYRCEITCSVLSTYSSTLYLRDTPNVARPYSDYIHICTGRDDTLGLLQPYGGPGVGWQWQYSPTWNGVYTDIAGATSDTFMVSAANYSNSSFFKCNQVCSSNGASEASWWVNEAPNPHPMCYCYATHNNPCNLNNYYISSFEILSTTLNNSAVCIDTLVVNTLGNNYQFFDPALGYTTATLVPGNTYTFRVVSTNQQQRFQFWLDSDGNGNFDTYEWDFIWMVPANTQGNIPITIPSGAAIGQTGLRIRSCIFCWPDSTAACYPINSGTTHDYIVTIDTTVSISNVEEQSLSFQLYPNPATKELTVSSGSMQQGGSIYIQNMLGETVYTHHSPLTTYQTTFNIVALPPGIYFVKLQTEKGITVKKFVKQ